MITFDEPSLERAYPYRAGWKVTGCLGLGFAVLAAGGVLLVPVCCDQWRNGNVAFGALAVLGAPCTLLAALMAVATFVLAVKETVRPTLLRLTPAALLLPDAARGQPLQKDARGNPKYDGPWTHPVQIPFAAIRWIRREAGTSGPGDDKLLIVHALSEATLELHQSMMRPADFDELETVLRAAVPEAFAALPVPALPPPPPADAI
jgi:hypothetical protein